MIEGYVKSILMVVLSLSGNFFAEILGCNTQQLLSSSMFFKHLLQLISIYISMDIYDSKIKHPITKLKNTLILYSIFLMFNKMNIYFTALVSLLILAIFIINNYIEYYKTIRKDTTTLEKINKIISNVSLFTILIGFIIYYLDKKGEYTKNWDMYKFIFGIPNCKGLKN
tara:strand:+ start:498 stop:1004 length:507 start_codon:yes stop_codon:yes gene_type:complete